MQHSDPFASAGLTALACLWSAAVALGAPPADNGTAQEAETVPVALEYGPQVATRYRVGARVVARGGTVEDIRIMVAVPLECPEQEVEILEEDYSPEVENVEFRQTDDGVRQMLIYVPVLSPRQDAHAMITYEVRTATILPPAETASLRAPKKPHQQLKRFLGSSPYIDVNHRKIRAAVKEALAATGDDGGDATENPEETTQAEAAGKLNDWQRVEKLYDYAIERVAYEEGADKSSVQALADGRGDCQAISALFVAMCRTEKIPARMVWVDGHQYAEFYLEDATGAGRWFPVESAGRREFGEMSVARVILQKGDNFRVPERPRERLRYASDYTLLLAKPGRQPKVAYVREQL